MLNIHIIHLTMYIRNYLKDSDISSEQIEKIGKSSEIFISWFRRLIWKRLGIRVYSKLDNHKYLYSLNSDNIWCIVISILRSPTLFEFFRSIPKFEFPNHGTISSFSINLYSYLYIIKFNFWIFKFLRD